MKSAYELAMERLNKTAPSTTKLTEDQKRELADLDSQYSAKIAEREIFLKGQVAKASAEGDYGTIEELNKQLISERKALNSELEEKKQRIRDRQS